MDKTRPRVRTRLTRCPYCHDEAGKLASVACRDCLARHHTRCWDDHGRCSSCAGEVSLTADASPLLRRGRAETLLAGQGLEIGGITARPTPTRGRARLTRYFGGVVVFPVVVTAMVFLILSMVGPELFHGSYMVWPVHAVIFAGAMALGFAGARQLDLSDTENRT